MEMSQTMSVLAESAQWEALQDMEVERRERLQTFFTTPVSGVEVAMLATGIELILSGDRKIEAICQQSRECIQQELRGVQIGRRANKAYLKNSG